MDYEDLLHLLAAIIDKVGPVTVAQDADYGDKELSLVLPAGTNDIIVSLKDGVEPPGTCTVLVDGELVERSTF